MSLNIRQRLLWNDTCNIWKPDNEIADDGEMADTTYTLLASDLTCKFQSTMNANEVEDFAAFTGGQLQTLDHFRVEASQEIGKGYVVKKTTSTAPDMNTFWEVLSPPRIRQNAGKRKANFAEVFLKQLPRAPVGVE